MGQISSVGKPCDGKNIIEISSGNTEGHDDWNTLEYLDTATSKDKKVKKVFTFYKMETNEISDRCIAPCFVNGLEAYDGEINLGNEENMISNEFADDVKPCVIFGRSFMRLTEGIVDFGNKTITIYPELDLVLEDSDESRKSTDD
ncbi:hypothetical protein Tco_1205106 [Tanacetum coccineum]